MDPSQSTQNSQHPPPYPGQFPSPNTAQKDPVGNPSYYQDPQAPNATSGPAMPVPVHHGTGRGPQMAEVRPVCEHAVYVPVGACQSQLYDRCARGEHQATTTFGPCGIITAIFCFPIGFLCLFADREKSCIRCGKRLG